MSKLRKVSIYFILFLYVCGACNYGFTKIYLVLPLIIPLFILIGKDEKLFNISLVITIVGFVVNFTIFYNPLFFPTLLDPEFRVKKDCQLRIYSDGSSGFYNATENKKIMVIDDSKKIFIKKGTKFPIKKLFTFGGIDSQNELYISSGDFHFNPTDEFIETRLPIENPILKYAGHIVYLPFILIVVPMSIFRIF